jgi:hypothetical protein
VDLELVDLDGLEGACASGELLRDLRGTRQQLWLKVAAQKKSGSTDYAAARFEVIISSQPPTNATATWVYRDAWLAASRIEQAVLAEILSSKAAAVEVNGRTVEFPRVRDQYIWRRHASKTTAAGTPAAWPEVQFTTTSAQDTSLDLPQSPVIARGAPSFHTWPAALAAFFEPDRAPQPIANPPSKYGAVRWLDERARIQQVRILSTHVTVTVDGPDIEDCIVELVSYAHRDGRGVRAGEPVVIPLPEGLPDATSLFLVRDYGWVDQRALPSPVWDRDSGVETVDVVDPETIVDAYLSRGEGVDLEFKSILPTTDDAKKKISRTVAAFANGNGGTIVFGIDPDEATICGIDTAIAIASRDQMTRIFTDRVRPVPTIHCETLAYGDRSVVTVNVAAGNVPPYGLATNPPIYYVRRGATTVPAQPEEIAAAVLSRRADRSPAWAGLVFGS